MKKKSISALLAAAILLSGCSSTDDKPQTTETSEAEITSEPAVTTTSGISALEGAPEDTSVSTAEESTLPDEPEAFPVPYPVGGVNDPEMLELFTGIVKDAEIAESILHGSQTLVPLAERLDGDYFLIAADYAETKSGLSKMVGKPFATYYWAETYGYALDYLLYEDNTMGSPRVSYIDDKLAFFNCADRAQVTIDPTTSVISSMEGDHARVIALGSLDGKYYWKTYTMINGYRGWVVEKTDIQETSGEIAVFSQLLINEAETLDKIFGGAKPVMGEDGAQVIEDLKIKDDPYGHGFYKGLEIEPFMTVEEMRTYLRKTFTKEIAESYISLYVNRTFIESDGRLFMKEGAVLPQMGSFSLANYSSYVIGAFDVTSYVGWSDGEQEYNLPVTICYEDGVWKLDTRLPMKADRIMKRQ